MPGGETEYKRSKFWIAGLFFLMRGFLTRLLEGTATQKLRTVCHPMKARRRDRLTNCERILQAEMGLFLYL